MNSTEEMTLEEKLKCSYSYDPIIGKLFWINRFGGREAFGSKRKDGYLHGQAGGKVLLAHRVAWLLYYGQWPEDQIDHINGVRDDNRIVNLRVVSSAENGCNKKRRVDNASGVTGVHWHKRNQKFQAYIKVGGKMKHLGYFDTLDEAVVIRQEAESEHGYHPNHGRR